VEATTEESEDYRRLKMYVLLNEPSGGDSKEAFEVLDETFGSGEFTSGQAVSAINVALEVGTSKAQSLFNKLVADDYIGEN